MHDMKAKTASYDLHLHTYWSYDGVAAIEPYFQAARRLGLRCISVTEHHNMDGMEEVLEIAAHYPDVRLIIAAELTVSCSIGAIDLLCYGLPRKPSGALAEVFEDYRIWQQEVGAAVSRSMQKIGIDYDEQKRLEILKTYRPERVIKRQGITHVKGGLQRKAFIEKYGYAKDEDSYRELLIRSQKVISRPPHPAVAKVAPAVKEAGGLVVIAHPTKYFLQKDRERMDLLRHECLLDGIECAHRSVVPELTAVYREYCQEHNLVSTGGSDSHEPGDLLSLEPQPLDRYTPERSFATHIGEDEWLDEFLEVLDSKN